MSCPCLQGQSCSVLKVFEDRVRACDCVVFAFGAESMLPPVPRLLLSGPRSISCYLGMARWRDAREEFVRHHRVLMVAYSCCCRCLDVRARRASTSMLTTLAGLLEHIMTLGWILTLDRCMPFATRLARSLRLLHECEGGAVLLVGRLCS